MSTLGMRRLLKGVVFLFFMGIGVSGLALAEQQAPAQNQGNPIQPGGLTPAPGQPLANMQTDHLTGTSWSFSGTSGGNIVTDTMRSVATYYHTMALGYRAFAQTRYFEAEGAGQRVMAERQMIVSQILTDELTRLERIDAESDRALVKETKSVANLHRLKQGRTGTALFQALGYFFVHVIPPKKLKEILSARVPPLKGVDNFIPLQPRRPVVDFKGGNVGQFLLFLKVNQLELRRAASAEAALQVLLDLDASLTKIAEVEIDQRRKNHEENRKAILASWHLKP